VQPGEKKKPQQHAGNRAGEKDKRSARWTELEKCDGPGRLVGVFAFQPEPGAPGDGTQHPTLSQAPEGVNGRPKADAEDDGTRPHCSSSGQVSKFVHQDEHTQGDEGNQSRHAFSVGETSHCRARALLPILTSALRFVPQLAVSLFLVTGAGCAGRAHDLQDGTYVFTIPADGVFRDDCGLADAGSTLQGQFTSYGDDIRVATVQQASSACLDIELVGQFQLNNQTFFADGTATNPPLTVSGRICQVNFVQFHLDGATIDSASFNGVMRISYLASSPVACNCQFWFNFQAALCTPPACPPVPTECS
jgi:hypothetical protein